MSRHKHKYCRYFHVGMILTITSFFSNGWLNIYTNITFTADVGMKLNWHYLQLITPDQMYELLLLGIAGINPLNPISAGVILTPIHAGEEGGGAKMSYPSNLCFKHPVKLKLGMDDHLSNWSWVTIFVVISDSIFCWCQQNLHPRCKLPHV